MKVPSNSKLFLILAVILTLPAAALHAQGFGKSKKKITLHRKLPHAVHLTGTAIAVKSGARDPRGNDVSEQLTEILETELLKDDSRLRVDRSKPETLITCTITTFDMQRPTTVTHGALIQDNRHPSAPTYTYRFSGTLGVAYQAKEVRTGKAIDSDNITAKYFEEFDQSGEQTAKSWSDKFKKMGNKVGQIMPGKGHDTGTEAPPDAPTMQRILVERAAAQIAARLVNTEEQIEVYLARGKLDDFNKMAEANLWKEYLEALETQKPLEDKEDDAYRLYNIGVAYEALAYGAEDLKNARKFFDEAAINYGKAMDAKPSEKYFLEPQNRIRTAIAHYKRLEEHEATSGKSHRGEEHAHDELASSGGPSKGPSADAMTNDDVVRLVKANLDEENIIAAIKSAPAVKFDFSVDSLVKLADNGVKGKLLTTMRERANAGAAKRRTASSVTKPTPVATKK